MKLSRSLITKPVIAVVVLAAAGTASVAQARSNVYFSIGANVAPGVVIGAGNAPYYYGPAYGAYVAPPPVYVAPAPVYYQPAPAYYGYGPGLAIQYYWSPVHHRYYYYQHGRRHWR